MGNHLTDHRIIGISRPDKRVNMFIQGGTSASFTLPKAITQIKQHAFDNISGLTEVVFTNQDVVVEVANGSGIPAAAKFIVPAKFLSAYQAKYPNRTVETRGVIWTVLFIGETTLTKAYINQCVLQEPELANAEVVNIPNDFTDYESGVFGVIFARLTKLTMIESPWLNGEANELTLTIVGTGTITKTLVDTQLQKVANIGSNIANLEFGSGFTGYEVDYATSITTYIPNISGVIFADLHRKTSISGGPSEKDYLPSSITSISILSAWIGDIGYSIRYTYAKNLITADRCTVTTALKVFFPSLQTVPRGRWFFQGYQGGKKAFLGSPTFTLTQSETSISQSGTQFFYVRADSILAYIAATSGKTNLVIRGVLDGSGIYNHMFDDTSMNYPTLSSSLTINSNGHLIDNGADLFDGYTATWYSDEDCTTVILDPTTITASDTAYVRLTAI